MLTLSSRTTYPSAMIRLLALQVCERRGKARTRQSSLGAIVKAKANRMMAELHYRLPVLLDPQDFDGWMTGTIEAAGQLLTACPSEDF
jgi:putative SOS response-associated peptidase YedK